MDDDQDDGFDDNGNPTTVQAAQKHFHKSGNGLYCAK